MPDPGFPFRLRAGAMPEPAAPPGLRLAGVAAELEAAFPRRPHPAAGAPDPPATVRSHQTARRAVSPSLVGLVAAAALGGLAAGTVLPKPSPQGTRTAEAAPVTALPVLAPAPSFAPGASASVRWSPAPSTAPATAPAPPQVETRRTAPPVRAAAKAKARGACPGRASRSQWCAYRAVLAADQRLRQAYARAVRAGAPYDELAAQRRRWDRLRHRASRDPDYVVERYGQIARALDGARRRARS